MLPRRLRFAGELDFIRHLHRLIVLYAAFKAAMQVFYASWT
jgi:hypothetical protein